MKKAVIIAICLVSVLFFGCAVKNDAEAAQPSTDIMQAEQAADEAEAPLPEPATEPGAPEIALPAELSYNARVQTETKENGVYSVMLPEEGTDHPTMPTYYWYINGTNADIINEVVIDFDVFETVLPLNGQYSGYDKAFFIVLHNFDKIPSLPPWPDSYISFRRGDIDENVMLKWPEFGVDLKKYAVRQGEHVQIIIPYSEFQNAAKDLTLQFLPGTTYGDLSICLRAEGDVLYPETIDAVSQRIEYPERDLMNAEIKPLFTTGMEPFPIVSNPASELNGRIHHGGNINVMQAGLVVNPDGSVNMPVSLYDLGAYENQVQCKYAVIPEGIVPALANLKGYDGFTKEQMRDVVTFVINEMMIQDGQFYGIYDIEQQKLVATERKAASLPILSELVSFRNLERGPNEYYRFVSNNVIDKIANAMIANEIVRVGDTLYYAPYGIDSNGAMELKLADFAFTSAFFRLLTEYSQDENRLREKYGCAMLLEGISNSLGLILEGQEQNETRLPSTELRVIFSSDYNSYTLQPSETFSINNSYFSVGLMEYAGYYSNVDQFAFYKNGYNESIDHTAMRLGEVNDGAYTQSQVQAIRLMEVRFAEMTNAYQICNALYKSWLNVYDFLKIQPSDTIYANAYNVHTGEMIEAQAEVNYHSFEWVNPFIKRFGTPGTSMNYFLLTGIFNDESMGLESGHLALVNLDLHLALFSPFSAVNPDTYADVGFNIWGYDSLRYAISGNMPITMETYPLFGGAGTSLNHRSWLTYVKSKINQFTEDEANYLTPEDMFPLFYDDMAAIEIVN